jgi:KaiC/GvpD/RAD55 family RecA-like ATPase
MKKEGGLVKRVHEVMKFKKSGVERVSTGVIGFDNLIEGGFVKNSVISIIGPSGTGKTTFALQFLLAGLMQGEHGFLISMEEPWEQYVRDYRSMGWDSIELFFKERKLRFVRFIGSQFKKFILEKISDILEYSFFSKRHIRIVIDPLTPLIWSYADKNVLRKLLSNFFYKLKNVGTVVGIVEKYSDKDVNTAIPIFLSDGVILMDNLGIGGEYNYSIKILKMRATQIPEEVFEYKILPGFGVYVRPKKTEMEFQTPLDYSELFAEVESILSKHLTGAKKTDLFKKLLAFKDKCGNIQNIEEILNQFLKFHNLPTVY